MLRFTLATALCVALAAPVAAHAWGGCTPHVYPKTYTVGDQTVEAYEVRMIC
jgi:hypothetical protein